MVFLTGNISTGIYAAEGRITASINGVGCAADRGVNANESSQFASISCAQPVSPGDHTVSLSGIGGSVYGRLSVVEF